MAVAKYTFSSPPPYRGVARVLGGALLLSVLINLYLLAFRGGCSGCAGCGDDDERDGVVADVGDPTPDDGASPTPAPTATDDDGEEPTAANQEPVTAEAGVGEFASLRGIDVPLKVNLSVTIDGVVSGRRAAWVTATTGRIMVWWLDMSTDLRAGDRLRLLYQPGTADEVRLAALRYQSQKKEQEFRAYYFQPPSLEQGSYWDETGREVPPRLKESMIEGYDQITAVLGDGRDHKGYDFRAPSGTPVFAPRDATVLRTTWNFKYNGNSLELRYGDGTIARYLHLEGLADGLNAGSSVRAGQTVGRSGNTGRTNAPHLHYELEQAGRIVDPIEYHGATYRSLTGAELSSLQALVAQYDRALDALSGG